ncbi:MAG TPA: hypothetical protein H9795_06685, partial [Candidatus Fournierella merdigallinarum]|nr:hypothetical protein [Candidatus Fournierella merdigallinarum]
METANGRRPGPFGESAGPPGMGEKAGRALTGSTGPEHKKAGPPFGRPGLQPVEKGHLSVVFFSYKERECGIMVWGDKNAGKERRKQRTTGI